MLAPTKLHNIAGTRGFSANSPRRKKLIVDDSVPKTLWNLLVANALMGGTPAQSKKGNTIIPPAPAMELTKPAPNATTVNPIICSDVNSMSGSRQLLLLGITASIMSGKVFAYLPQVFAVMLTGNNHFVAVHTLIRVIPRNQKNGHLCFIGDPQKS